VGTEAATLVWAVVNMDAILYENRSHYYYGVTVLQRPCNVAHSMLRRNAEQRRRSC
jgi:hypothetical protein